MKKINITIILTIIGLILLVLGFILQYTDFTSKHKEDNSINISKKHCLNGICISSMKIGTEIDNSNYVTGTIIKENDEELSQGLINIVFDVNKEKIVLPYFYYFVSPIKKYDFKIPSVNKKIIDATNYKIEKPTEKQLKYFYKKTLSSDKEN